MTRVPPKKLLPVLATAVVAGFVLAGCSDDSDPTIVPGGQGGIAQPGITAHGVGKVTGTPDVVTVTLGVQTQGGSAKQALDANNAKATEVITSLKDKGVEEKDLQTSQLSINPTYSPDTGRIIGYEVTNQVTATVRDIDKAGDLIDGAAQIAGDAVRVQGLSFSIDNDGDLKARAREQAVQEAKAQAEQMANAAGVRLGKILSITEEAASPPQPYLPGLARDEAAQLAVPIEPGSQELTLAVNVVWDINQ